MKSDHDYDTNLGYWTERPERELRPSSFQPISGRFRTRRPERIWTKAALVIALMVMFAWAVSRLASQ